MSATSYQKHNAVAVFNRQYDVLLGAGGIFIVFSLLGTAWANYIWRTAQDLIRLALPLGTRDSRETG